MTVLSKDSTSSPSDECLPSLLPPILRHSILRCVLPPRCRGDMTRSHWDVLSHDNKMHPTSCRKMWSKKNKFTVDNCRLIRHHFLTPLRAFPFGTVLYTLCRGLLDSGPSLLEWWCMLYAVVCWKSVTCLFIFILKRVTVKILAWVSEETELLIVLTLWRTRLTFEVGPDACWIML